MYAHTHKDTHAHTHTHTHTHTHSHSHSHYHRITHKYRHTYICTYIHTYKHIYTQTYIHTHASIRPMSPDNIIHCHPTGPIQVMLESKWKSPMSKGKRRWTKIRNLILGVAQFRQALRRNSVSRHSNSGSECDRVSRASVDSYADDHSKGSSMSSVAGVGSGRAMFSAEKGGDGEGKEAHGREDGGESVSCSSGQFLVRQGSR